MDYPRKQDAAFYPDIRLIVVGVAADLHGMGEKDRGGLTVELHQPPGVSWHGMTEGFRAWLRDHPHAVLLPHVRGREAEIWRFAPAGETLFCVKRWRKDYPASARAGFAFLAAAQHYALPVAPPAGWGDDSAGGQVLATHYVGEPLRTPASAQVERSAHILADIHRTPTYQLGLSAPDSRNCLVDHLCTTRFAGIEGQPDLASLLTSFRSRVPARNLGLCHGDFHLGNVMERHGKLSIIDWTDVELSDQAFDVAWAGALLWIYRNPGEYDLFLQSYARHVAGAVDTRHLVELEAIAGLRWILLARTAPVPIEEDKLLAADVFVRSRLPRRRQAELEKPRVAG